VLRLDHKPISLEQRADGSVRLDFANGVTADADAVVGADGVQSVVRGTLFDGNEPAAVSCAKLLLPQGSPGHRYLHVSPYLSKPKQTSPNCESVTVELSLDKSTE